MSIDPNHIHEYIQRIVAEQARRSGHPQWCFACEKKSVILTTGTKVISMSRFLYLSLPDFTCPECAVCGAVYPNLKQYKKICDAFTRVYPCCMAMSGAC